MKKTLISIAMIAASAASFAQTCNGDAACSPDQRTNTTTVGDNRNGQFANGGSIANGANVQAYGGTGGRGGTSNVATGAATTTGGTATGGTATGGTANVTGGNATSGAATSSSTSGAANTTSGAATSSSTSGAANTTSGAATSTSGAATSTSGAATSTSGAATSTSGAATTTGGNITGGTVGAQTVTGASVAGNSGSSTVSITQGDNASTVEAAKVAADAARDVAASNAAAARDAANRASTITIKNTPNVSNAALTSSNDTCMGSVSVGGSGPGIGISIGSTYKDENCVMLKNSRELWNMGFKGAALALMCTDKANKEALELTGFICPQTTRDAQTASANSGAQSPQYTDPIVRQRMGLPPLK